jgi:hypothetical protein
MKYRRKKLVGFVKWFSMLRRPAPSLNILVVVLVTVGIVHPVAVAVALIIVEVHRAVLALPKSDIESSFTAPTVFGQAP